MKKLMIIVTIVLLLSGCGGDKTITVFIDEEEYCIGDEIIDRNEIKEVAELSQQLLEIMYKNYNDDIVEFDMNNFGEDDISDFFHYVNYKSIEVAKIKHYRVLDYAEKEKEEYYLKLIIKKAVLKEYYDVDIANFYEKQIDSLVNDAIRMYNNELYDNEIVFVLNKLANEKGLSFEEYAKKIYGTYLEFSGIEGLYPDVFVEGELGISIVKPINMNDIQQVKTEDWENAKEYFDNQIAIIEACDEYLEEIYSQAERGNG